MTDLFWKSATGAWSPIGAVGSDPAPPDPPDPPSPDRPPLDAAPSAATTGPRVAITGGTLSGDQAIALAKANGGTLVGRRISNMTMSEASEGGLIFQDCEFGGTPGGGGNYILNTFFVSPYGRPAQGNPPIFDHCRFVGGGSSTVVGYDHILLSCELTAGVDLYKPFGGVEMYACYLHSTWHPDGAHCDAIQVQTGSNFLIHWNQVLAFNHSNSPTQGGSFSSGGLQTGKTLGSLTNWRMWDNWVDGGQYTLRGPDNPDGYAMDMQFRRNKHGRDFNFGPITRMNEPGTDYDSSNVWQDNGLPVSGG